MRTCLVRTGAVRRDVTVYDYATLAGARRLLCVSCKGRVFAEATDDRRVVELVCSGCTRTVGQVVLPECACPPSLACHHRAGIRNTDRRGYRDERRHRW